MRWFTRDFVTGRLSDEEWKRRQAAYASHLNRIGAELADGAEELIASVHLHDGQVDAWRRHDDVIEFAVLVGDLQRGYEWLTLRYRDAALSGATDQDLQRWRLTESAEIIEDEVDRLEDGSYEHRWLVWPDGEFGVRFRALEVARRPATAAERR